MPPIRLPYHFQAILWKRTAVLDLGDGSPYGASVRTLALLLATAGGVGYAPLIPGTWGALVAVPFLPLLAQLRTSSLPAYVTVLLVVVVASIWSAGRAEHLLGDHDDSRIVIDEVAGQLMAGIFLPGTWLAAGLAFFLFRVFDVIKPFPAGLIDRRGSGGFGVVGDDLVAGVYAGLVARLLLRLL